MRLPSVAVLLLLLAIFVSACGDDGQDEILVFTAASLTDVMGEVGEGFTEDTGIVVRFNLGGSTSLAQQIIRGAPADAFISAGPEPMDQVEADGRLLTGTRRDILTNELVLVGRRSPAEDLAIMSLEDLLNTNLRVTIADPDLSPAGRYAREALVNLGLWESIEQRIVPGQNVRVALGYVETGSVDLGIIYRTDLLATDDVLVLAEIPAESYSPIVYPAAAIRESQHSSASEKFVAYLSGDVAGEVFRHHGFTPLLIP